MAKKYLILNCFACGFSAGVAMSLFGDGCFFGGLICLLLAIANLPFMIKLYDYFNQLKGF